MMGQAATSQKQDVPQAGDVIAEKYCVERVVGTGGMGVVVSARHMMLGHNVAIKILRVAEEERRQELTARFLREAQAAGMLRSDHVVRIHDVGQLASGLPFMVMELLIGSDLGQLLEQNGPMPEAQAVDFVLQACAGVAEAHAVGIVHRDLKPSNLFVTERSDGLPLLKVLDFGISKLMGDPRTEEAALVLTSTRSVMGSPYYMSPEQVRDPRRVDERADVWALGVILHELLTGEPPFQGETFPGVCASIVVDPPRSLRLTRPDVSEGLEAVVATCLQKQVRFRYQTITKLAQALGPYGSRQPSAGSDPRRLVYSSGTTLAARKIPSGSLEAAPSDGDGATLVQPPARVEPYVAGSPKAEPDTLLSHERAIVVPHIVELRPPHGSGAQRFRRLLALAAGALALSAALFLAFRAREPMAVQPQSTAGPAAGSFTPHLAVPAQPAASNTPVAGATSAAAREPTPQASVKPPARQPPRVQAKPAVSAQVAPSDIRLQR